MAGLLNFFGYYRIIPEVDYTFYSTESYSYVSKKHPVSNYRTLDLLKDFLGYLMTNTPDAFSPAFVRAPEYSYY